MARRNGRGKKSEKLTPWILTLRLVSVRCCHCESVSSIILRYSRPLYLFTAVPTKNQQQRHHQVQNLGGKKKRTDHATLGREHGTPPRSLKSQLHIKAYFMLSFSKSKRYSRYGYNMKKKKLGPFFCNMCATRRTFSAISIRRLAALSLLSPVSYAGVFKERE